MSHTPDNSQPTPRLWDLLRTEQQQIIDDWVQRVRAVSPAQDLPAPSLIDHLPRILARMAGMIERDPGAAPADLAAAPESHAIDRLGRGFALNDVVAEYSLLRQCILDRWAREAGDFIRLSDLRRLDAAFEYSVSESISEYASARDRLLVAVDRIADAALGSADVTTFLHHLLRATVETATAVDTVAVLLREGDLLRVRAATGLEREVELGFTLKIGEGFAGKIAAEAKPWALTAASTDPVVQSPILRQRGIKALYGVPLIHNGEVIGVAHMGSATAREFSDEDKLLFRTMANRATAVIVQADLVERERRAHEELKETHARVVRIAESQRFVLAVVSHDLKNPIAVIQMTAQLLRRATSAPAPKQLDALERSLDTMNHLIADLLDVATIQGGNLTVSPAPHQVDDLVAEAVQLHEPLAMEHGIHVASRLVTPDLVVEADHHRVQQVFGNLIGNAVKFSPAGSTIAVSATVEGREVVFSVADQGPGIAPDELPRIFEPYWSGQRHGKKSTGMGLFISQGIVRAHGGRIWVESQPGKGSTFYFALPLARPDGVPGHVDEPR